MSKRFPANPNIKSPRAGKHRDGYTNPRHYIHAPSESQFQKAYFVCWDGEGATINGKHEYILLMHNRLQKTGQKPLVNLSGLSSESCLDYLCESAQKLPGYAIHVIFGGSYDANMILKDMPQHLVKILWEKGSVLYGRYKILYRQRKQLTIHQLPKNKTMWIRVYTRTHRDGSTTTKRIWNYISSVTIWDVHGFFQSSFVKAIRDNLKDHNKDEVKSIEDHKAIRAVFDPSQIDDIIAYTTLEVKYLESLMSDLVQNMSTADVSLDGTVRPLVINRWDGAGAIAASLLKRYGVKQHMSGKSDDKERVNNHYIEEPVKSWARHAYAGGRIEQFKYGHHKGRIYQYDVVSAYPSAMIHLPSLAKGKWIEIDPNNVHIGDYPFALWDVEWHWNDDNDTIMPFFFRNAHNAICFPRNGRGFYWTPEMEAALIWCSYAHTTRQMNIRKGWAWIPATDEKPFAFVQEIFNRRAEMKRQKNGSHKVLKLGLNSLYGKTAQQKGHISPGEHEPNIPYFQLEWAGWITSYTRAKLFMAAMQKQDAIISIMTDGIMSLEPLDVSIGNQLGQWEESSEIIEYIGVKPGIYFTKYKEPIGVDSNGDEIYWKETYRGYDPQQIRRENVLDAYTRKEASIFAPCTRFITMGAALSGGSMWEKWHEWYEQERELCLWFRDTKRESHTPREWGKRRNNPAYQLMPTWPLFSMAGEYSRGNNVHGEGAYDPQIGSDVSCAYVKKWDTLEEDKDSDGVPISIADSEHEDSHL